MASEKVDFHVHVDGSNVSNVLEMARKNNVVAIGLIGRGEIPDRLEVCIKQGRENGVKIIPGVEYASTVNGKTVDLIALGFDTSAESVRQYWGRDNSRQMGINREVATKQKDFLEKHGFVFEGLDEAGQKILGSLLGGEITEKAIRFCWLAAQNEENCKELARAKITFREEWEQVTRKYSEMPGYEVEGALDAKFLWSIYFAPGKEGYIPVLTQSSRIIDAVHEAGGVVLYSPEGNFNDDDWKQLLEEGVDGIMGWHGKKYEISKKTAIEAIKRGLLVLGGSDFYSNANQWQVGVGDGTMFISPRRLKEYEVYLKAKFSL